MSLCFIHDDIDKCVKTTRKREWPYEKKKWFVLDETDAAELRFPGKWKTEWSTTSGAFIA